MRQIVSYGYWVGLDYSCRLAALLTPTLIAILS